MCEIEFEMTDQEFEDYILEESGRNRDEFTIPLLNDKEFILLAIRYYGEFCDEVFYRIPSNLLDDEDVWKEIYRCDPHGNMEFYGSEMPEKLSENSRFIARLVRYNSIIIEYISKDVINEEVIYAALNVIEENNQDWEYADEFMYIAYHTPTKLFENESFVYEMICYASRYLYKDEDMAKEFFDMISKELWNEKKFVLEILENDDITRMFDFLSDYISDELKQDEDVLEYFEEDEEE